MPTPENASEKPDYKKAVEQIDGLLATFAAGGGQRTISIGGVTFSYASVGELLRLRSHFAALAATQEGPARVRHYAIDTILTV